ncbi:hypothetical protein BKA69DRAFT_1026024, partial [Paraphysoderma sedebokerense]
IIETLEGDNFHPPENIQKMSKGIPLQDEDRWNWLSSICSDIGRIVQTWTSGINNDNKVENGIILVSCSALKFRYRDYIHQKLGHELKNSSAALYSVSLTFVYLRIETLTVIQRLKARNGHFMPASLVESQFAALEEPSASERPSCADSNKSIDYSVEIVKVDDRDFDAIVEQIGGIILRKLSLS